MADEIYTRLETEFKGIRDERGLHANTATRIGTAFLELLYLLRRFGIYEGKLASEDYVKDQQGFAIYKEGDKWKIEIDNAQIRNLLTAAEAEIGEATIDQAEIGTIKNRTEFLLGLKTFGSILLGNYASGVEGGIITATGDAELKELVTRGLARLAELLVDGDSAFGGKLSSLLFNSGFLTGQGWAILKEKVINAAGVEEDKYTLEIDNVTVRGLLRVYELVVSQLRGEYDNYRFAAMMSIHHYDPETGRIWLETEGGRIKGNPYNAGTYIECQQYQPGNDVVSGGDGYLTKHYEFIVKEAGTGGMTDVSGDRLDWITFKNFTTQIEGGTPESLIQKGNVIVRADHKTDPERKGVVDIMTVGPKTPYMDVVYGRKTNPEDFLKSRIGNLEGVRTDLFGWLEGFGAYINNFYGVGKFFNRQTGEGLEARIEGTRQHLQSVYTETTFNISDDDNYITNGFFQRGLQSWVICETDGTPLSGEDDDEMIGSGDEPLLFNGNLLAYRNRLTAEPVVKDGIRMLHLLGMGVSQDFSLIKSNGYHDEMASAIDTSDTSFVTVADTLYMGIRILPVTSGTLSFKFRKNNGSVIGREFNLNAGHDWLLQQAMDSKSQPWDYTGSGKLVISYTGECYIRFVALQTDPIVNSKTQFTTLFEQTSRRITLEAKKASDDLTEAVASINIEYNRLTTTVTNNKTAADNALDSLRSRATSLEGRATSAEGRLDDLEDDSSSYATWIEQTDRTINLWAAQFDASGNIKKFSAIEQSISNIQTTVTNNKTAADNALDSLRSRATSLEGRATSAEGRLDDLEDDSSSYATWIEQTDRTINLWAAQFDASGNIKKFSAIEQSIDGISSTVQSHTSSISSLNNSMSTANGNISTLQGNVTTLQSNYSSLVSTVSGISGRVTTVEGYKTTIDSHTSSIGSLNSEMDGMESQLTSATSRVSALEIDNSSIKQFVTKYEQSGVPINNAGEWEMGNTSESDTSIADRTYDNIKVSSTNVCRTRKLFRVTTATFCTLNSGYNVGMVFFTENQRVYSTTPWSGWKAPASNGVCSFDIPTVVKYAALLFRKADASNISDYSVTIRKSGVTITSDTLVTGAEIALFITEDDLSNIQLKADNIDFEFSNRWSVKAKNHSEVMSLDTNGDLTVKGVIRCEMVYSNVSTMTGDGNINPATSRCNVIHLVSGVTAKLPRSNDYPGLEVTFFSRATTRTWWNPIIEADDPIYIGEEDLVTDASNQVQLKRNLAAKFLSVGSSWQLIGGSVEKVS